MLFYLFFYRSYLYVKHASFKIHTQNLVTMTSGQLSTEKSEADVNTCMWIYNCWVFFSSFSIFIHWLINNFFFVWKIKKQQYSDEPVSVNPFARHRQSEISSASGNAFRGKFFLKSLLDYKNLMHPCNSNLFTMSKIISAFLFPTPSHSLTKERERNVQFCNATLLTCNGFNISKNDFLVSQL